MGALSLLVSSGLGVMIWRMPLPAPAVSPIHLPSTLEGHQETDTSRKTPNLLLITLDTFRPDHLSSYGYRKVRTPHLDALAKEGVVFERAQVQAPLTSVSHASILTSLYPPRHGVRAVTRSPMLSKRAVTLTEILRDAGYSTGAVVAAAPLAPGSGLERGFDRYDFESSPGRSAFFGMRQSMVARVTSRLQIFPDYGAFRRASEQTDHALGWLDSGATAPFFLWVHYFDAHDPYAPPRRVMGADLHPGTSWVDRFCRWYLYDSEVALVDAEIGRLMEGLRQRGLEDRTVVAIISDHGEGLGEHGYVGHSSRLFDEQLHAAFLLRDPSMLPQGFRLRSQVREIDLMPTLLELLGRDVPQGLQGMSLLPLIQGIAAPHDLLSLSETMQSRRGSLVSASDGRFKLIHAPHTDDWTLYDLEGDPRETENVAATRKTDLERLRQSILAYLGEGSPTDGRPNPANPEIEMKLRSLGYVH